MSNILKLVSTSTCPCSENITPVNGSCLSQKGKEIVKKFNHTNCKTEVCILQSPEFLALLGPHEKQIILTDLNLRFKGTGPKDNQFLSNVHIDNTLRRWAAEFDNFYNCPFAMIDFELTGGALAAVQLRRVYLGQESQDLPGQRSVKRPCRTFACVLNTDVSTGPGKHWVVVFVDMRGPEWSVEYFNSTGNAPPREIVAWLGKTKNNLSQLNPKINIITYSILHQESKTECGPYTLFYVRARLEGVPTHTFHSTKIPDDAVQEFRSHIFL